MTDKTSINDLRAIMKRLRDPIEGCSWDIEQTFKTIIPYTIEETYEVVDAIERNDKIDLCAELGDLLLQVIYYAQMAEEEGSFTFDDVVASICKKMIRRHPHVYGSIEERSNGLQKGMWDKIKAEEKAEVAARKRKAGLPDNLPTGLLNSVPDTLPSLLKSQALQDKAAKVGFDWNNIPAVLEKLNEEIGELLATQDESEARRVDEMGDVLFVVVNLARHMGVNADTALRQTNMKFKRRFSHIEKTLETEGKAIESASLDEMEALWLAAKIPERQDDL